MIESGQNRTDPPIIPGWIIKHFARYEQERSILGDFDEEFYEIADTRGLKFARYWYWRHFIKSIPVLFIDYLYWSNAMLQNYIKIALRNIKKQKGYSFINISGLAVGMACFILMLLWVQDETSWDRSFKDSDSLYRVICVKQLQNLEYNASKAPNALSTILKNEYGEIIESTRYCGGWLSWVVRFEDKIFENDLLGTADPSFFKVFPFPFLKGDPETALVKKNSIVLTESMAKKYFGKKDPMGKIIKVERAELSVTGIIKDIPHNSSLQFDYIFPLANMEYLWSEDLESWTRDARFNTFVQLRKDCSISGFFQKISGVVKRHYDKSNIIKTWLQPVKDIHLKSNFADDEMNIGKGSIKVVYIFSLTAFLILLIACINFMNLSTARSGGRGKEVGMRKVAGADRLDIVKQFFGESLFLCFLALFLAVILTYLLLPAFNDISGKYLKLDIAGDIKIIFFLTAVTLLTGIISGSYPAVYISSFQPVKVLKSSVLTKGSKRSITRKFLVVTQFVFTIILIFGTIVIYNQLSFIKNKDLGFDKDSVLFFSGSSWFGRNFETVKNELLSNPDILFVSKSRPPDKLVGITTEVDWAGKNPNENFQMFQAIVDYDYLNLFKMDMTEGRFFSKDFPSDTSNYILNETAVTLMGIKDPIGKQFILNEKPGIIIGVIRDFHCSSLHNEMKPILFRMRRGNWYVSVKYNSENLAQVISFLKAKWKKDIPDRPFTYKFLDESIHSSYGNEQKISSIFRYFTLLAVFLSCLGLFGLASYTAEQRTKEIGIRKTLGASVPGIVFLLSKEFIKWVIAANIVAWPLAWFSMTVWLDNFAYKIEINAWMFLISGGAALFIVLASVGYQTFKAAKANPVKSLKYE